MKYCPNCGESSDGVYCIKCGTKLDDKNDNDVNIHNDNNFNDDFIVNNPSPSFLDQYGIIILGYIVLIADIICIIGGNSNVRVINSDRLMLYPFLGFIACTIAAFSIAKNSKNIIHSIIIEVIALILLILGF